MKRLDALLAEGVLLGTFPACRAEVWHRGLRRYVGGNVAEGSLFDVASLTKVLATTRLLLELHEDGVLSVGDRLRRWLPEAAADVTLEDLLYHRSGLPAFLPFFAQTLTEHPGLRSLECPPALRARARTELLARVAAVAPTQPAGQGAVYSDLGFMLLGHVLERASGLPLDQLFHERVATPLGLSAHFRRVSASLPLPASLAPTGATRPREPAPGQEGLWDVPTTPGHPGEVDDDNAYCLDGVSGHAGLFATAHDVGRIGLATLHPLGQSHGPTAWRRPWGPDATTPGSTRALGFDTPSAQGASCGPRFGRAGPRGAIGHLGFTGTSLWMDLDRELIVVLLTNRVATGRANLAIRDFRPRFHDAVLDALEASSD